jgi:hypothetical protein
MDKEINKPFEPSENFIGGVPQLTEEEKLKFQQEIGKSMAAPGIKEMVENLMEAQKEPRPNKLKFSEEFMVQVQNYLNRKKNENKLTKGAKAKIEKDRKAKRRNAKKQRKINRKK